MGLRATLCIITALGLLLAPALGTFEAEEPSVAPKPFSLDTPHLTREFETVQNFKLVVDGMRETVKTEEDCQAKCIQRESCRSYSWSATGTKDQPGKTCIWSAKYIGFDPDWTFYTRTYAVDVSGKLTMTGPFHAFSGMRFVEDRFHAEQKGLSLDECQEQCEQDGKCLAYSFSPGHGECLLSDGAVRYAPGFSYNERNQPVPGKPGKFRPYPKVATASQKQEAKNHHRYEAGLAAGDKRQRETKVAAKAHLASQLAAKTQEQEAIQKEAAMAVQEKQHKSTADTKRLAQLQSDLKTAEEQGNYAETVVKSKLNVMQAVGFKSKEKSMKKAEGRKKAQAAITKARKKDRQEAKEMSLKKQVSKLSADVAQTDKVSAKLQYERAARLLRVEAFKLAQKERQVKGKLTPEINKLISEEVTLQEEQTKLQAGLAKNARKFRDMAQQKRQLDAQLQMDIKDTKKKQRAEIKLVNLEGKKKLQKTKEDIDKAGPELKLQRLRVMDRVERALYDNRAGFIDGLTGRDAVIVVNNTYVCQSSIAEQPPATELAPLLQASDSEEGPIKCMDTSQSKLQEAMDQAFKVRFRLQDAGGYPFIAFNLFHDAMVQRPAPSGRMCTTAANEGGELFQCKKEMPKSGRLENDMIFVLDLGRRNTFSIKTKGSGKSCRQTDDLKIICDANDLPKDDPTKMFKIFPFEAFKENPSFITYASKSMCSLHEKLDTKKSHGAKPCQDLCCANKDCQFVTFLPTEKKDEGECHMFRTCQSMTNRVKVPKGAMFRTDQKTGLYCDH